MFAPADHFARRMTHVHGAQGAAWLARLPTIIERCARRWRLVVGPPFAPLSYNYVAAALRADGKPVVLKVGYPSREFLGEIDALRHYAGRGAVRLLASSKRQGALLLERLTPGMPLARLVLAGEDERATAVMAGVMRALWQPLPEEHRFPSLQRWTRGLRLYQRRYRAGDGPLPGALVERAVRLCAELIATAAPPVLLHSDLHHENILTAERAPWLAIDPKGVAGEPAFEVGAMFHNPMPGILALPDLPRVLERRVAILADDLALERRRVRDWGLVYCVLSAAWSTESGEGRGPAIACAELLAEIGG